MQGLHRFVPALNKGLKASCFSQVNSLHSVSKRGFRTDLKSPTAFKSVARVDVFRNLLGGLRSFSTTTPPPTPPTGNETTTPNPRSSDSTAQDAASEYWTKRKEEHNPHEQKLRASAEKARQAMEAEQISLQQKREQAEAFWNNLTPHQKDVQLRRLQAKRDRAAKENRSKDILYYAIAVGIFCLTAGYLAVPLYAAFCQATGFGGSVRRDTDIESLNQYMDRTAHISADAPPLRTITVRFSSNVHSSMDWEFKPEQRSIQLRIGDTALAFYKAKNNMDVPFTGVSTYNVIPPQAGLYFNKIQCFCFDEQRLRAGEDMDMPLFFFLDPAMADDWRLDGINDITLHYSFFPASEDDDLSSNDDIVNFALKPENTIAMPATSFAEVAPPASTSSISLPQEITMTTPVQVATPNESS